MDLKQKEIMAKEAMAKGQASVKAVKVDNANGVSAFTITLDNSAGMSATSYRIFDGAGLVADIAGAATAPSSGTVSPSVIAETTKSKAIVIKGFNYQASSNTQFAQRFDFAKANIDGRLVTLPNVIAKARRNTQFDSTLLTIDENIVIDYATALDVTVIAGGTVDLTFFVEGFIG